MDATNKNILTIGLGLALIIISNIIGHFAASFSIFATPFLLTIIIAGINFQLYKINFILTVIYNFGLLVFNDLFIRFYAGGTHDQVGKFLISLFFAMAFTLALFIMTIYSFILNDNHTSKTKNVLTNIFILLSSSILTGLIYYFIISDI